MRLVTRVVWFCIRGEVTSYSTIRIYRRKRLAIVRMFPWCLRSKAAVLVVGTLRRYFFFFFLTFKEDGGVQREIDVYRLLTSFMIRSRKVNEKYHLSCRS